MFNFKKDENQIGVLTMDMAGKSTNVITKDFAAEFSKQIEIIFKDAQLKGLVIASAKKDFLAGADLAMFYRVEKAEDCMPMLKKINDTFCFMEKQGKPVVAAINGTALGGGLELTLACHYRVCIDDPKIQLGLPEVTLGLLPGAGGTQRLPRLIGIQPAIEMMTLGNRIEPQKAHKLGVVHELVKNAEELMRQAKAWILKNSNVQQPWHDKKFKIPGGAVQSLTGYQVIAASNAMVYDKTFNNYPSPKAILSCIYEGLQVPFESGLDIEASYFTQVVLSPVSKNLIKTMFFGMQACNKGMARPKDIPPQPVKKVGILGAGLMGGGIAYATAKAGIEVVLKDLTVANAEKGKNYSVKLCDGQIEKGRLTTDKKEKLLSLIKTTDKIEDLKDCDLIIETVFEDSRVKAKVTQEAESVAVASLVMASNTSSIPITKLAGASKRPDRFIGLHFFSPVDKMPLVEIIVGQKTGPEALAKAIDYTLQIKKTPIVVNDGFGFFTTRVICDYVYEGFRMVKEGVVPALIENGAKMAGMPVGPLVIADEVNLDLVGHLIQQSIEHLGPNSVDQSAIEIIEVMVEQNKRLGRKVSAGFYEYPAQGKKFLWPQIGDYFKQSAEQPDVQEIKDRLLTIQVLTAIKLWEEKVLRTTVEGDVGSILGIGFPPYTGGVLSYVDFVGVKSFVEQCKRLADKHGARFKPSEFLMKKASNNERLTNADLI